MFLYHMETQINILQLTARVCIGSDMAFIKIMDMAFIKIKKFCDDGDVDNCSK